jgi:glycosyltransferase involved in cell wall biosynthesis
MDMKKSIYFIIDTMGVGGAETQLLRIIPHLISYNWEIHLVTIKDKNEFREELDKSDVVYSTLDYSSGYLTFTGNVRKLAAEINESKSKNRVIIHSHIVSSNLFSRFLTLFLKGNSVLVNTVHNTNEGSSWRYLMYRLTKNRADFVSAMCQAAIDVHRKKRASRADRLHLVYNAVDLNHFQRNTLVREKMRAEFKVNDDFVWLAVGNLAPQKNFSNLLKAWKQLVSLSGRNARLFIVGEGAEKDHLKKYITQNALGESVQLLGRRFDVKNLLNMADGFVMSSDWEGFPMVLLEASASRLPVVTTDVGGCGEIVKDGISGYLCPPRNQLALAESMKKLTELPVEELEKMGSAGRRNVQDNFNVESIARQWNEIYDALLQQK